MPGINSGDKPGWRCIVRTTTIHCGVRRDNDNDTDDDGDDDDDDDDQSESGLMSTICRFYRQWTIRDFVKGMRGLKACRPNPQQGPLQSLVEMEPPKAVQF